jgi:phospholipid/cholesterol/gamma-HCH transport system substrate-binding protein
MKYNQNKREYEFKVGLFTVVALIVLIAGYLWLTNAFNLHKYNHIGISFNEANRLEVGTAVFVRGIDCGKVEDITLRENDVLVSIQLTKDVILARDSKFIITDSDLMGHKIVKIIPGKSSEKMLYNQIQKGENSVQIADLFDKVSSITDGLNKLFSSDSAGILGKISNLVNKSEETIDNFDQILAENKNNINQTFEDLNDSVADLKEIISENKAEFSQAGELVPTMKNALISFNDIIDELDVTLKEIKTKPNNINRLISDDGLYENLINTTSNLDSLIIDIKKNPKRYFKLF